LVNEFAAAARVELADAQLRHNLRRATRAIREKRARAVAELDDWEQLREAGRRIKAHAVRHLDVHLEALERSVTAAGGVVHWAPDAAAANAIVTELVRAAGATEVVKVKSITTDEIGLGAALAANGITPHETDLAELIIQLAGDRSSHFLVPAIHLNRAEIGALFRARLPGTEGLSDDPAALAEAARRFLRERFLSARVAVSGANFAVAETGTVVVVESEGNGRMCTTLPQTLVTVMGIEKLLPRFCDLGVMLQLLPRSSTAERMNPYTSLWTGVRPGDGPREFHLVLLDNGRTDTLADRVGRDALHCIRCSACLNVCPVYERTGGHAYQSPYPGPIGAILTPQLAGLREGTSLPWASSLCGACYQVCPVKIDIPTVLVHLRGRIVGEHRAHGGGGERAAMRALAAVMSSRRRYELAQRAARIGAWPLSSDGRIERQLPGPLAGWTAVRDLPAPPKQTFRQWWRQTHPTTPQPPRPAGRRSPQPPGPAASP
jgi:L-lactate dehydrogenase complex protein LldF